MFIFFTQDKQLFYKGPEHVLQEVSQALHSLVELSASLNKVT